MAIPNFLDPSYTLTLAVSTPVILPVPSNSTTAVFAYERGVEEDVYVSGGTSVVASASTISPATATVSFTSPIDGTDPTGLANDATTYEAVLIVNGTNYNISVVGSDAQTFDDLIVELNDDSDTDGTWSVAGGTLQFETTDTGVSQTVSLTDDEDDPLFSVLTNFAGISTVQGDVSPGSPMNPDQLRVLGSNYLTLQASGTINVNVTFSRG